MAKYKVGDKVRVISNGQCGVTYYMEDRTSHDCMVDKMIAWCGKVVTIKRADRNNYAIKEFGYNWTDEMFEGLAEEELKFKVGDRVIASDNLGEYHEAPGTIIAIEPNTTHPYRVKFDQNGIRLWSKVHRLIEEEPTPVVNINVTVNLYENACWYCRKGGLVDLYLDGAMGICPSCGRVCNNARKVT